jgi:GDP-4-dehydro-6-deoxy-D-mannose reductase
MPHATLVTGAAGFAGGHLLELIVGSGGSDEIVAWHRPGREQLPTFDGRVRWEAVDVLDRAAVRGSVARDKPAAVYHCAGAAHVGRAWDSTDTTFAVNVRGTHYLLDALERASVEATVLIPSSALVYTPADRPLTEHDPLVPSSPYGLSKLAQEMLAHHAGRGVTVTVARAFNHVGARQHPYFAASGFARRIADIEKGRWEPAISVGNLDARRDFTDVRDTVRAYRLILEHGAAGEAFNVCSGVALGIGELLDRLIARARVPVSIKVDAARYRPNDVPLLVGDPAKIREQLGWAPAIPLERTLDDLLEYWRRQE